MYLTLLTYIIVTLSGVVFAPQNQTAFIEKLAPSVKNGGFEMDDYWVWGASVIKGEDGKYHMFASRWPR